VFSRAGIGWFTRDIDLDNGLALRCDLSSHLGPHCANADAMRGRMADADEELVTVGVSLIEAITCGHLVGIDFIIARRYVDYQELAVEPWFHSLPDLVVVDLLPKTGDLFAAYHNPILPHVASDAMGGGVDGCVSWRKIDR